jgi:hypothetical protein
MIFVLSAIGPEKMRDVLMRAKEVRFYHFHRWTHRPVAQMLREGGLLLFRDYGLYDMTQVRFISKKGRKLADNYYARADGTRTYFFSEEHMAELATNAGFEIVLNKYDTRELRNRKRQVRVICAAVASRHIPNGLWITLTRSDLDVPCVCARCVPEAFDHRSAASAASIRLWWPVAHTPACCCCACRRGHT